MTILLSLLRLLSLYQYRDCWMTHSLDKRRELYQEQIKRLKERVQ